ncbi:MAG TPA: putative baseplate assembly protein, partial [Dehalococcoidia bacterium]|nr:putative baseplate assembly protein [Dehalococcoidia bacterium]
PPYLWVSVAATLKATRRADREGLRHAAEGALYSYIHPTRGGPEGAGWPFGRPLHISELYSLLQGVSGVEYVEALDLYPVDAATGQQQAAAQRVTPPPDGLLCSHTHTVKVS